MRLPTLFVAALLPAAAFAGNEAPWRTPAHPLLSLPKATVEPVIDGVINQEEWRDALQLGSFFHVELDTVAPEALATQLYLKWDTDYLYMAIRSKLAPEGTGLRASERRRGQADGIRAGDHYVFEILPVRTRGAAEVSRIGSFTWIWNALDAYADFHLNIQPGQRGSDWVSDIDLANRVTETHWESEMRIPLAQLAHHNYAQALQLPPSVGDSWSIHAARRFGAAGDGIDLALTPARSVFFGRQSSDWNQAWATMPEFRLMDNGVVMHLSSLGALTERRLQPEWAFSNSGTDARTVQIDLVIRDTDGESVFTWEETLSVPGGETIPGPELLEMLPLEPSSGFLGSADDEKNKLYLRVRDDAGNFLHIAPGLPFIVFNSELKRQFERSLEILRE